MIVHVLKIQEGSEGGVSQPTSVMDLRSAWKAVPRLPPARWSHAPSAFVLALAAAAARRSSGIIFFLTFLAAGSSASSV